MRRWHASGRTPLPLQVKPLTSHLFPVGGEAEEGMDGKRREEQGVMQGCILLRVIKKVKKTGQENFVTFWLY